MSAPLLRSGSCTRYVDSKSLKFAKNLKTNVENGIRVFPESEDDCADAVEDDRLPPPPSPPCTCGKNLELPPTPPQMGLKQGKSQMKSSNKL